MRVAIVFYGLMRNLRATFPSIHKYIFKSMRRGGIEFDVYLHTYYLETLSNFRSKEENVSLDNEEWKMLYPKAYLVDRQDEVDQFLPHEEFCRLENPWPVSDPTRNSMRNLLRQLYSLKRAWSLLESEKPYDGYLILRPDLVYQHPLILPSRLPVANDVICMPEWGAGSTLGYNDRICFTSWEGARVVMNRLDSVMDYGRAHPPHSQIFLRHVVDSHPFRKRFLSLGAKRVRAGDHSVPVKEKTQQWYDVAMQDFQSKTSHAFWAVDGDVFVLFETDLKEISS